MTIASVGNRKQYSGDGVSSAFAFPHRFFDDGDVWVYVLTGATEVRKTLTTDYTITNTGTESGGTVTFIVAPASGAVVTLIGYTPYTQVTDYATNDAFPAEAHETALDRATRLIQQVNERASRAIKVPVSSGLVNVQTDLPVSDAILAWNSTATGIVNGPTVALIAAAAADSRVYANEAALPAVTTADNGTWARVLHAAGVQAWLVVAGAWVFQQWLEGPRFATVALMLADTSTSLGATGQIIEAGGFRYQIVTTGEHRTTAGGVKILVLADACGKINVKAWGTTGDGAADDTAVLVAIASTIQDGQTLVFPEGSYLISYTNAATHQSGAAYGRVVMPFSNLKNIHIEANNAKILVVNHDCSTGGLTFINFKSCPKWSVRGFLFDMTFTGVNTSAALYPFCGAITAIDSDAAGQTQAQLNGDAVVEKCEFKLYHPYGSYAQSGAPFGGDANNGFKIFSVFASGPYLATAYAEQCRNITIRDCTFKDGHNAYGIWVWAWNNVLVENNTAESYVSKQSNASGVISGAGVSFIRYMQWHCSGIKVVKNSFTAKPCNERTGAFTGSANFAALAAQLLGDYSHGETIVSNNTITLGNGDAASARTDYGVDISTYGSAIVADNTFDGIATTTNAYASASVYYSPEVNSSGNGKGSLSVTGNTFGASLSYDNNITILNGSSVSDYERRAKSIVIADNTSLSQAQYFLDMTGGSAATYKGSRTTSIVDNIIVGTFNTVFSSASSNSRAMRLAANVAGDRLSVRGNIVRDKYTVAIASDVVSTADVLFDDNKVSGETSLFVGAPTTMVQSLTKTALYTPVVTGSTTAGAGTYTAQFGKYYRVGNIYHYNISITMTAHTGTGQMLVSLPFTSRSTANGGSINGYSGVAWYSNLAAGADKQVTFLIAPNASTGALSAVDSNDGASAVVAIDGTCTLALSGWYEAGI